MRKNPGGSEEMGHDPNLKNESYDVGFLRSKVRPIIFSLALLFAIPSCDLPLSTKEVKTEVNENNDTIKKYIYDDGSWGEEVIKDMDHEYHGYYPGGKKKCDCYRSEGERKIIVYNENRKVMFENKFSRFNTNENCGKKEITYDEKRGTKTTVITSPSGRVKRIIIQNSELGEVVSDDIRGEDDCIIFKYEDLDKFFAKMGVQEAYRFEGRFYGYY